MERRAFGRTGLTVPAIGMGTWKSFDVAADDPRPRALIDAAVAAGTTLFDTSPMYGKAERTLAAAVDGRRDSLTIADKVWTPSPREAREQIDQALSWYGGSIDVYQIHNLVAWREHLPTLEALRERGAVRVIGATHYQHGALPELLTVMRTGRIGMIQIPYNAADRLVEREVLPLAAELGLGVLVMQPLGSGALLRRDPGPGALEPLARFGVHSWAQVLLKWILSDPRVHCAIPATHRPGRATENAGAGTPPWFDDETRDRVSQLAGARA